MTAQQLGAEAIKTIYQDGFALLNFQTCFGKDLWEKLVASVEAFQRSEQFFFQRDNFLKGESSGKDFLIRPSWIRPEGPWAEVAEHPLMLQMARAHFQGGNPLLADCDLWHTDPMPEGRERKYSQNWHVDMEAQRMAFRIFKAFLYFNDIEDGNGPLEVWKVASSLTESGQVSVCAPRGTMVLVDTGAILHRGGYCKTGSRTVGLWHYTNGSNMTIPPLVSGRLAEERATA